MYSPPEGTQITKGTEARLCLNGSRTNIKYFKGGHGANNVPSILLSAKSERSGTYLVIFDSCLHKTSVQIGLCP